MKSLTILAITVFLLSCNSNTETKPVITDTLQFEDPIPDSVLPRSFAIISYVPLQTFKDSLAKINARYLAAIKALQIDVAMFKADKPKFVSDTVLNSKARNSTLLSIQQMKQDVSDLGSNLDITIDLVKDTMLARTNKTWAYYENLNTRAYQWRREDSARFQKYVDSNYVLSTLDFYPENATKTIRIKK